LSEAQNAEELAINAADSLETLSEVKFLEDVPIGGQKFPRRRERAALEPREIKMGTV
jgi:hypothetical protein